MNRSQTLFAVVCPYGTIYPGSIFSTRYEAEHELKFFESRYLPGSGVKTIYARVAEGGSELPGSRVTLGGSADDEKTGH